MTKEYEILERLSGDGKIFRDGKFAFEGRYNLTASQEIHSLDLPGDKTIRKEGHHKLNGFIQVDSPDLLLRNVGKKLTLELNDSRRIEIWLCGADGRVEAAGWFIPNDESEGD